MKSNLGVKWYLFILAATMLNAGIIKGAISKTSVDDKEAARLVALADKMILTSSRLSSTQDADGLAIVDEYVPLAEYVVKTLGKR